MPLGELAVVETHAVVEQQLDVVADDAVRMVVGRHFELRPDNLYQVADDSELRRGKMQGLVGGVCEKRIAQDIPPQSRAVNEIGVKQHTDELGVFARYGLERTDLSRCKGDDALVAVVVTRLAVGDGTTRHVFQEQGVKSPIDHIGFQLLRLVALHHSDQRMSERQLEYPAIGLYRVQFDYIHTIFFYGAKVVIYCVVAAVFRIIPPEKVKMVNIAFVGVSAGKGNLPNFATEIKNEAIMNTKRNLLLITGLLLAVATSQAQQSNDRIPAKGFAFHAEDGHFHDYEFTRHPIGDNDVQIKILYAGICHSDIHEAEGIKERNGAPCVLGHEIAGEVIAVGKNVTKFKVGDYAGVGCMVNSCGSCSMCDADKEQFCENSTTFTYDYPDKYHGGELSQGGYSDNIVVSERFAISIPKDADMKRIAPLLCAGVTTWSPIRFSNVQKGQKVAVAGYGGLGHMAVQYLVDLGADVTVFDITEEKRGDALRMGASRYVNVNKEEEMKGLANSFDFILSTIPANFTPIMYARMLKMGGELAIVGLDGKAEINTLQMILTAAHRKVYASLIGGIKETQEMLDYSVAHGIYPEVEIIPADAAAIDEAYKNVLDGKVKFRYVIDMSTMNK